MTVAEQLRRDALRRYFVFRMKLVELFHFHLLMEALVDEKFVPENVMGHEGRDFAYTVRTALLSWYCTIVDRSEGGLNIFNVWRELFPNHRDEIEQVRARVEPDWVAPPLSRFLRQGGQWIFTCPSAFSPPTLSAKNADKGGASLGNYLGGKDGPAPSKIRLTDAMIQRVLKHLPLKFERVKVQPNHIARIREPGGSGSRAGLAS